MSTPRVISSLLRGSAILALALLAAAPVGAQYLGGGTKTPHETLVADLEQMRDKFLSLGEAIPEDLYGWRPMEGVRSVSAVLMLIAAEAALFPTAWGFDRPDWVAEGNFGAEQQRLRALSPADLRANLRRAADHVIALARDLTPEDRERQVNFFGLTVDLQTAFTLMATDWHEHLGQLIAYARMNEIVPPWSRRS